MKNNIYIIIPARYASSRFPGKPLARINGKPMIQWVYESASKTKEIDGVYVATDDKRIADAVKGYGGQYIMTSDQHQSGSDRLAECAEILSLKDEDIVLNIQGDEPLISTDMIEDLLSTMSDNVYMGTLKEKISNIEDIHNPNIVKVLSDVNHNAIYFSRASIPYNRNEDDSAVYYRHVGVYAYKVWFLKKYTQLPRNGIESIEGLEQLRVLENGYKIHVHETVHTSLGVDTPEQIKIVENLMCKRVIKEI